MFSSTVMDHFHNPRNVGTLASCSGIGLAGSGDKGRFVQVSLKIQGAVISAARFKTYGCVPAIAAGSVLMDWVEGRTVVEARSLTVAQLLDQLGGLPPQRIFCAELAIEALRKALDNAESEAPPCS